MLHHQTRGKLGKHVKPNGMHLGHDTVMFIDLPQVSLDHRAPEVVEQAFPAPSQFSDP